MIIFLPAAFFTLHFFKWVCFMPVHYEVITGQKHVGPYGWTRYPHTSFILMLLFVTTIIY